MLQLMDNLNRNEEMHSYEAEGCNWVPEYGAWMIEATPSRRKHAFLVLSFFVSPNCNTALNFYFSMRSIHRIQFGPTPRGTEHAPTSETPLDGTEGE